jgi:hypothetical protein
MFGIYFVCILVYIFLVHIHVLTAIRDLKKDEEYDYPYNWFSCCDALGDRSRDSGDPMTNFVLPVTTSGKSYRLFQGS